MTVVIGVDPGIDGAVAVLDRMDGWADDLTVIPTIGIPSDFGRGRMLDTQKMLDVFNRIIRADEVAVIAVERVGARPGQGGSSMFKFGFTTGWVVGALQAMCADATVLHVTPQKWKAAVGIPNGADKDASRARATELYPKFAGLFMRKKDNGAADATLIAHAASHGLIL